MRCSSLSTNIIGLDCCLNGAKNANYARNNVGIGQDIFLGGYDLYIKMNDGERVNNVLVHSTITVLIMCHVLSLKYP